MKRSLADRAKLAKKIAKGQTERAWTGFINNWTAFNAIYSEFHRRNTESDAINETIIELFDETAASRCLDDIDQKATDYLLRLPPGDDRLAPHDPGFRRRTRELAAVFSSPAESPEKL